MIIYLSGQRDAQMAELPFTLVPAKGGLYFLIGWLSVSSGMFNVCKYDFLFDIKWDCKSVYSVCNYYKSMLQTLSVKVRLHGIINIPLYVCKNPSFVNIQLGTGSVWMQCVQESRPDWRSKHCVGVIRQTPGWLNDFKYNWNVLKDQNL